MNNKTIEKASEIIHSKSNYIGGGMEGIATLTLIDENGYPVSSTLTISKTDGIKWLTFLTSLDSSSAKRANNNSRACVCLNSSEYHISLMGDIEVLTDEKTKKEMWQEPLSYHFKGPDDPQYCVLRFTTKYYSIYIVDGDLLDKGLL